MWVDESARGLGLGRRLLSELERHAALHGARIVRLETNRSLVEAISLYRSAGYGRSRTVQRRALRAPLVRKEAHSWLVAMMWGVGMVTANISISLRWLRGGTQPDPRRSSRRRRDAASPVGVQDRCLASPCRGRKAASLARTPMPSQRWRPASARMSWGEHVRAGPRRVGPQLSGWWGEDPPYHVQVFVLTHHPREPLVMQGGTTFNFVTDGIERALELAKAASAGANVRSQRRERHQAIHGRGPARSADPAHRPDRARERREAARRRGRPVLSAPRRS